MDTLSSYPQEIKLYTIYVLIDPRDNIPCYVGMTNDVYRRFQQHIGCYGNNEAKNDWIRSLREANIMVVMKTLETVSTLEEARQRELYWVEIYRKSGFHLFNFDMANMVARPNSGRRTSMAETRKIIEYRIMHKRYPENVSDYMKGYFERLYMRRTGKYYQRMRQWRKELTGSESAQEA